LALITACLIVRDEEKVLDRCLASLDGLVDEIVVGDTGSLDLTPAIARDRGARIIEAPWEDDFSRARNRVLDCASGRWILVIDADELVRCEDKTAVRRLLEREEYAGWQIMHQPQQGWTPCLTLRVFPNAPDIRFEGIIHESVRASLGRKAGCKPPVFGVLPFSIIHDGYDGDQSAKHLRNLPLLSRELDRDPRQVHILRHYALCLRARGDIPSADKTLEAALTLVRERGPRSASDSIPFVDSLTLAMERKLPVSSLMEDAAGLFPDHPHILWFRGLMHLREGEYDRAGRCFGRLLFMGKTGDYDTGVSCPEAIYGRLPLEALGECAFLSGDYREGEARYAELSRRYPENIEYRIKKAFCSARRFQREPVGDDW
jgi:glycosyltransferase involved in cell wall biosynthesis